MVCQASWSFALDLNPNAGDEAPSVDRNQAYHFDLPHYPPSQVGYQLQWSTNLVDWLVIATKDGAQPWVSDPGSSHFYSGSSAAR